MFPPPLVRGWVAVWRVVDRSGAVVSGLKEGRGRTCLPISNLESRLPGEGRLAGTGSPPLETEGLERGTETSIGVMKRVS